jgi:hypothetical protein
MRLRRKPSHSTPVASLRLFYQRLNPGGSKRPPGFCLAAAARLFRLGLLLDAKAEKSANRPICTRRWDRYHIEWIFRGVRKPT